jgi:cobalt-zinc-cadmium efflux system protein
VTIADIPPSESACILVRLKYVLKERFHISHATIQFEHMGCEEMEGCVVPMEEMASGHSHSHRGHGH